MRICRTLSISILTALLAAGTLTFADADARSVSYDLNIPSEDLTAALQSFAIASHHKLLYKAELTTGKMSRALKGHFTAQEAMEALLSGTGLSYEITGSSVVLIKDQPNGKTSELREEGTAPSPPRAAPQSSGGQPILLAQADQGKSTSDVPVDKSEDKSKKDKTEGLSEIVVTGTLIHNVAPITPVMTITQSDLIEQGYTTLADAIFDLPQNFQGAGTSPSSNAFNGAGGSLAAYNLTYASGVNLRGLGGSATLVLLNGRRLAQTAYGNTVDISQIPVSAIDRVEILTDGASALYGSDAVAGVVNIITKREFSGFEIDGRSTGISHGKTPDYGADIVGGYSWGSGGLVAGADYQKDNPLFARNRSFTILPDPWALSPQDQAEHLYLSVNQAFTDRLKFSMDTLVTHRDLEAQVNNFDLASTSLRSAKVDQYNVSPQLDYTFLPSWTASLIGQWSKERDLSEIFYPPPLASHSQTVPIDYQVSSLEPRVDGKLFDLPGGGVRVALGGLWREEKLDYSKFQGVPGGETFRGGFEPSRRVASTYGELLVPIVGRDNAIPFVQELRIDMSGRYDHYSDFGGTTNPKVGISWSPVSDLKVHGSYAKSFQAPTLYDLSTAGELDAFVAPFADSNSSTGSSLGLADVSVGNPNLQPETAKTFNVGFTYQPEFAPGLKLDASYFSIDFNNEITYLYGQFCGNAVFCTLQDQAALGSLFQKNPTLAEINSILNNPAYILTNYAGGHYTPAPYVPSDITAIANIGVENAASTRVRGVDFAPRYVGPDTQYGRFRADLDASYFLEYKERVTSGSPSLDIDNTTSNPLRFRAKSNVGWEYRGWAANARVNFANAYKNTLDTSCPSGCTISSWTTVDMGLSYAVPNAADASWLRGIRLAIVATNIFDRAPPFVSTGNTTENFGYDAVNASPLMRSISITFAKRWGAEASQ